MAHRATVVSCTSRSAATVAGVTPGIESNERHASASTRRAAATSASWRERALASRASARDFRRLCLACAARSSEMLALTVVMNGLPMTCPIGSAAPMAAPTPYSDATGSVTPQDHGEANVSTPQHGERHLTRPSGQGPHKPQQEKVQHARNRERRKEMMQAT